MTGWSGVGRDEVFSTEGVGRRRGVYGGLFFDRTGGRPASFLAEGLAPDMRRVRKPPSRRLVLRAQAEDGEARKWVALLRAGSQVFVHGGRLVLEDDGLLCFQSEAPGGG